MASATETAILALVAALNAQAALSPAPFPQPTRNNTLPARFSASVPTFSDVTFFFNLCDGNGAVSQETLGHPDQVPSTYEIHHRVEIELAVQAANNSDREAAFDAALLGIDDALKVDRSLGDAVSWCQIDETQRSNLVTDALPNTKGIVVYVRLEFFSDRPF